MSRQTKLEVHERDRHTCVACGETFDDISHLDVDHIVPRGAGGSNRMKNKASICRLSHQAKHDERAHAPTVRVQTTGDMSSTEFDWYVHFWKHQLPALSAVAMDYRIVPKFNLKDVPSEEAAWHLPLGDLRQLTENLGQIDVKYAPRGIEHYM